MTGTPTQNHSPSSARSSRKTSRSQTDVLQDKIQTRISGGAQLPSEATNQASPPLRIQARRIQAPTLPSTSCTIPPEISMPHSKAMVGVVRKSPETLETRSHHPSRKYGPIPTLVPVCRDFQAGRCHKPDCRSLHVPPPVTSRQPQVQSPAPTPVVCPTGALFQPPAYSPPMHPFLIYVDRFQQTHVLPTPPILSTVIATTDTHSPQTPEVISLTTATSTSMTPASSQREKKSDEVCQNHLKGQCCWGSRCHRKHVSPPTGKPSIERGTISKETSKPVSSPVVIASPQESQPSISAAGTGTDSNAAKLLPVSSNPPCPKDPNDRPEKIPSENSSTADSDLRKCNNQPSQEQGQTPPTITKSTTTSAYSIESQGTSRSPFWKVVEGRKMQLSLPSDVCRKFIYDTCSKARCRWKHLSLEEYEKYYMPAEPCRAYLDGWCSRGAACSLEHDPDYLPPSETSLTSTEEGSRTQASQPTRTTNTKGGTEVLVPREPIKDTKSSVTQQQAAGKMPRSSTCKNESVNTFEPSSSTESSPRSTRLSLASNTSSGVSDPSVTTPPLGTCRDWFYSICERPHCKYQHTCHPVRRFPQRKEQNPLDKLLHMLEASAKNPESLDGQKKVAIVKPTRVISDVAGKAPVVPPGLGLEKNCQSVPENTDTSRRPPEVLSLSVLDATKVTFGPGFEIRRLETGFESRDVLLKKIPASTKEHEIRQILEPFGEVTEVHFFDKKSSIMTVRAVFADHLHASRAVFALDGASLFDGVLDITLGSHKSTGLGKGVLRDGDVYLEFPAPSKTGFVGFTSQDCAEEAISKVSGTVMKNAFITAELFDGVPRVSAFTVRLNGLPPDTKVSDINELGPNNGVMLTPPNYRRLESALNRLREVLDMHGEVVRLDVTPPPYRKGVVQAWAHFKTPTAAEKVCRVMHMQNQWFIGKERISAQHSITVVYTIPAAVYSAISIDINRLRSSACTFDSRCNIETSRSNSEKSPDAPIRIKLLAENVPVLTRLKTSFETILRGDRLTYQGQFVWDPFFTRREGRAWIHQLQADFPNVRIELNELRRIIALFGPPAQRYSLRKILHSKVASLKALRTHTFPLEGRLIGLFMNADLIKLQEELGHDNVVLDLSRRILRVRGNQDAYQVAQLAINRAKNRHIGERSAPRTSCPVCLDEVNSPVTLECGHSWCKSCIAGFLRASVDNKVFPLTCLGNEARCAQPIALEVAREILSPSEFDSVIRASFFTYIHTHPKEFHYCPTPDCPQVYRSAPRDTVLQCPSCLTRICPSCHVTYHEGESCPDPDAEGTKLFDEWASRHDVKKCPGCQAPIERSEGCNHMMCIRCKTHICWVCLMTFSTGKEVYDHMHATHGGIGI